MSISTMQRATSHILFLVALDQEDLVLAPNNFVNKSFLCKYSFGRPEREREQSPSMFTLY